MDIYHERPGSVEIVLSLDDMSSFAVRSFCMTRFGLIGPESKTWVREDGFIEEPSATIDGDGDLNVNFPPLQPIPVTIPTERISAPGDDNRDRVEFYFGNTGGVTVRAK